MLLCTEPFLAAAGSEAAAAGLADLPRLTLRADLHELPAGDRETSVRSAVTGALAALVAPPAAGVSAPAGTEAEDVEVDDSLETITELFESRRWTDGLPIVPPTETRVEAMVSASGRLPQDLVAVLPPGNGAATAERIAINAVMAGCRPEHMPVLLAAVEAMADPRFNLNGIQGTTNPVAPLVIVNGPGRHRLGFNAGYGCFGPGTRANATVGRAIRLILINIGGGLPGERDMAVAGQPAKYTFCVAENEEETPWEPLSVERGFPADASVVTVVGISSIVNTLGGTAEELAEAVTFRGSNDYRFAGCPLFALNPVHARALARVRMSKQALKERIHELSRKPATQFPRPRLLPRESDLGPITDDSWVTIARSPDDLLVIVAGAGGAGGHSLVMPSFGNTEPVSRVF